MVTGGPYTPPVTRATFRRSAIAAAAVAVVSGAVLVPMGLGLYALFGGIGLGLGVLNSAMVVSAVAGFTTATAPSKVAFARSVVGRLALITIIAFGCALLFRPPGIATFAGIVVFQVLGVASSMVSLIKESRQK
ncbi:MAG: hypothetical protein ACRDRH_02090 [Pseudonocardia sp.]